MDNVFEQDWQMRRDPNTGRWCIEVTDLACWTVASMTLDDNAQEIGERIIACVKACRGMDDPAAEIENLRQELEERTS